MKTNSTKKQSGFMFWVLVWGLGLAGQLCWNMENQWFNTFVYEKVAKDPTIISFMVAASATATTISTFVCGTLSDRKGRRRKVVAIGYILWGIFTIAYGMTEFITKGAVGTGAKLVAIAGLSCVAADTVMSFFGSMGNDSGFNAWMNDHMNETNRGQLGAAVATQPIIGTIIGTVVGGMLVGADNNYMRLFLVIGGFVILCGILALFKMEDAEGLKPYKNGTFWQQFASVFNFKKYFELKELALCNLTLAVYFIGFNMYFTHLGNYMIYYLGFTADTMGLIEGIGLILGMALVFPATRLINKGNYTPVSVTSIIMTLVGLLVLAYGVTPASVDTTTLFNPLLLLGVFLVGAGYVTFLQTLTVWSKQLYPEESKGQFEGVRIVFFVLIPMVIAPLLSNPIIKKSGEIVNEYGITEYLPNETLFKAAFVITALTFIPLILSVRARKKAK